MKALFIARGRLSRFTKAAKDRLGNGILRPAVSPTTGDPASAAAVATVRKRRAGPGTADGGTGGGGGAARRNAAADPGLPSTSEPTGYKLVLVESPAKIEKIRSFLGPGYEVLATYGHVRTLPRAVGSVRPDRDFAMLFEPITRMNRRDVLGDIRKSLSGATELYLATDPDREGEAIAWHVREALSDAIGSIPVRRVTFTEITKSAVLSAFEKPREISRALLDAQLARLAIDYLFGFSLSPVLWRKIPTARSAGRVQSVALRLVCEREEERERFKAEEYWTLACQVKLPSGEVVPARLVRYGGRSLDKEPLRSRAEAEEALASLTGSPLAVSSVKSRTTKRDPLPPFITSSLQQDAVRRLGMSAKQAMMIAQRLYEEGHITYMRTDGLDMSSEAMADIRAHVAETMGAELLSPEPKQYKSKAKNKQESHECIRPTHASFNPAAAAAKFVGAELQLYELIWRRAVACQMAAGQLNQVTVDFAPPGDAGGASNSKAEPAFVLRSTGSQVAFRGFWAVWDPSGTKDAEAGAGEGEDGDRAGGPYRELSQLSASDAVSAIDPSTKQHFTDPPPRFNEASLVKSLEELGIGRPSTYAGIISVLQERGYVSKEGRVLFPSPGGRVLTDFLKLFFAQYVDYGFTSAIEAGLDEITGERMTRLDVLRGFWGDFAIACDKALEIPRRDVQEALDEVVGRHFFPEREDGTNPRQCPQCATGSIKLLWSSRTGPFFGCSNYGAKDTPAASEDASLEDSAEETIVSSAAEPQGLTLFNNGMKSTPAPAATGGCTFIRPFVMQTRGGADADDPSAGLPRELGTLLGQRVTLKMGPFGPYVQVGEDIEKPPPGPQPKKKKGRKKASVEAEMAANKPVKPKRVPFKGDLAAATLESVLPLLAYPRDLGEVEGKPMVIARGRFGPYIQHGTDNCTIPVRLDPLTLTVPEALGLIEAKKQRAEAKAAKLGISKRPAASESGAATEGPGPSEGAEAAAELEAAAGVGPAAAVVSIAASPARGRKKAVVEAEAEAGEAAPSPSAPRRRGVAKAAATAAPESAPPAKKGRAKKAAAAVADSGGESDGDGNNDGLRKRRTKAPVSVAVQDMFGGGGGAS